MKKYISSKAVVYYVVMKKGLLGQYKDMIRLGGDNIYIGIQCLAFKKIRNYSESMLNHQTAIFRRHNSKLIQKQLIFDCMVINFVLIQK